MDRAPGLSVRLKLTLSYAAFLMVAGALLLSVVWVFLLRYVPEILVGPGPGGPDRSDLVDAFAPKAALMLVFLLVFGLLGGWLLAGHMLAPLARITHATRLAATGSLSHRIQLEGRNDEFRELADAFDGMLARLEAHVAEQQRFAANASHELRTPLAITQTLLDVARNDPNRDNGELVDRLHLVNSRAIDLTEALLLLSRADQRSFAREHADLSLIAEEATETLLPFAEKRGVTIETSGDAAPTVGSPALLLQLTTNLVDNAIVHNVAEQGTVWVTTSAHPESVELTVENMRRAAHPIVRCHAGRAVPPRHRAHPNRARRRRPRPGDRQQHHPGPRRNPHPHPPGRRGALRHGATPRRPTAHRQLTIRGVPQPAARRAPSTSARSFAKARSRGRYFIPQSGPTWRRSSGMTVERASMRAATPSGVSAPARRARSSTPTITVLPAIGSSTAGSSFGCAASIASTSAAQSASSARNG